MIEVGEDLVDKNGICNLRRVKQVHLEQTGLQVSLLRLVVLERLKEERGRRLDHVLRHEDVDHLNLYFSRFPLNVD